MKCQLSKTNTVGNRQSSFELLRLLSMFFIVLYHFLLWFVEDHSSHICLKALWLPLHIGVICFVLISGYFRIKPTSRGFIKLISMVLIYSLPGMCFEIKNAEGWKEVVHSLMFVSQTNYWFVRTYIGLYLVSPLINTFLDHSSSKTRWYMLVVTGIISVYLGNFSNYYLYSDGKNLVNFIFLYQLGQMISLYFDQLRKIKVWKLLIAYASLNIFLVCCYYYSYDTGFGVLLWRLSFPYCSPILIINAILFFIIIGHFSFTSILLNRFSIGAFSIYLIHGNHPLVTGIQRNMVSSVFSYSNNYFEFVAMLTILALIVMLLCLLINWLLSPLWNLFSSFGNSIYKKLGF